MKCLLCNEKIDVVPLQRLPRDLFVAVDPNGNITISGSPCMHMHCVLKMKDQLDELNKAINEQNR